MSQKNWPFEHILLHLAKKKLLRIFLIENATVLVEKKIHITR